MYAKPRVGIPAFWRSQPAWMGTPHTQDKVLRPGGGHLDTSQFLNLVGQTQLTVGTGGAAASATAVPLSAPLAPSVDTVTSLPTGITLINAGTVLYFGAGKFARLTANGKLGDTSLTVEALVTALVAGDKAAYSTPYSLFPSGNNFPTEVYTPNPIVLSGTLIGRTYTERDAGTGYGPADVSADNEIGLLAFDVNLNDGNECEIYLPDAGNTVYENFLTNWATLAPNQKTWVRSHYVSLVGQP